MPSYILRAGYHICVLCACSRPSVLWHCWLGGRKGIRPVKTEWWDAGMVICLERDADLHTAQLMPLPLAVSCFSKIQTGFTFLVPAHPGSPGQRAVKRVCVCVCACSRRINKQNSVSQSVDMANLLTTHCSVTVSTVHLPNHIISLISLLIPLLTFLCAVLFTTRVSFCINYSLCMRTMFILGPL